MWGHQAPLQGGWVLPALRYEGLERKQEAPGFQQDWGLTAGRDRSPAGRGGCGKQSARALPETPPHPRQEELPRVLVLEATRVR